MFIFTFLYFQCLLFVIIYGQIILTLLVQGLVLKIKFIEILAYTVLKFTSTVLKYNQPFVC